MDLDELKRLLQGHFTDGLVTIVGSGLSAAAGLPSMQKLADHLRAAMPPFCQGSSADEWTRIEEELARGTDLETALRPTEAESELIPLIVNLTAELIYEAEHAAVGRIVRGEYDLPMTRLVPYLAFEGTAHIITSNYDRLIEFAVELAGYPVDTGFSGIHYGKYAPSQSRDSLSRLVFQRKPPSYKRVLRPHVSLYKPHGSLDWFLVKDEPVRCSHFVSGTRLMITPGTSKYRLGYNSPFDLHRAAANKAINNASGFFTIGYGFNDDQLETHLRPRLKAGQPCVLLARDLTENARIIVEQCGSVLALVDNRGTEGASTTCHYGGAVHVFEGTKLWDLNHFLREVLE